MSNVGKWQGASSLQTSGCRTHLLPDDLGDPRNSLAVRHIADVVLDADLLLLGLMVAEHDDCSTALEHLPRELEPNARSACCQLAPIKEQQTSSDENNVVAQVHLGRGREVDGPRKCGGCCQLRRPICSIPNVRHGPIRR